MTRSERAAVEDSPPDSDPAIRTIAMPTDTNPAGDIFGGWLLWQMDLAAGNAAARYARGQDGGGGAGACRESGKSQR